MAPGEVFDLWELYIQAHSKNNPLEDNIEGSETEGGA